MSDRKGSSPRFIYGAPGLKQRWAKHLQKDFKLSWAAASALAGTETVLLTYSDGSTSVSGIEFTDPANAVDGSIVTYSTGGGANGQLLFRGVPESGITPASVRFRVHYDASPILGSPAYSLDVKDRNPVPNLLINIPEAAFPYAPSGITATDWYTCPAPAGGWYLDALENLEFFFKVNISLGTLFWQIAKVDIEVTY